MCAKEAYSKAVRISKEDFINQSAIIHSNKFSYEKSKPLTRHDKVTIYCEIHKKYFEQRLNIHLKGYVGCKDCISDSKIKQNRELFGKKFIENFKNKFGDNYDFSKVNYVNNFTPVDIFCIKHNIWFKQANRNILRTRTCSCPQCKKE